LGRTKVGASAVAAHQIVRSSRQWEAISLEGALLYLAAMFEESVRETARKLALEVSLKATTYSSLPQSLRTNNRRAVGEVLRNPDSPRYSHLSLGVILQELTDVETNGAPPVRLFNDGLAANERNMRPNEITTIVGRFGVKKLWEGVSNEQALQAYFGSTKADLTLKATHSKLNAFIDARNAAAHGGSSRTTIGASVLYDYLDFLDALSTSLATTLDRWLTTGKAV